MTFDQLHGPIHSVGYRIGPVAYSPDVSDLDDAALAEVRGWSRDEAERRTTDAFFALFDRIPRP